MSAGRLELMVAALGFLQLPAEAPEFGKVCPSRWFAQEDVMEDNAVRRRIREMITTGALPCEDPPHLWAGRGEGKRCAGCAELITTGDIEYEAALTSGRMIGLHRRCYAIWQEECEPGPSTEAPASARG